MRLAIFGINAPAATDTKPAMSAMTELIFEKTVLMRPQRQPANPHGAEVGRTCACNPPCRARKEKMNAAECTDPSGRAMVRTMDEAKARRPRSGPDRVRADGRFHCRC